MAEIRIPGLKCAICLVRPREKWEIGEMKVEDAITILEGHALCNEHVFDVINGLNSESQYNAVYRAWKGNG